MNFISAVFGKASYPAMYRAQHWFRNCWCDPLITYNLHVIVKPDKNNGVSAYATSQPG